MKKKKLNWKSKLKLGLEKVKMSLKQVREYAAKNHLALLNLALISLCIMKLSKLEHLVIDAYYGLAGGIEMNIMLLLQLAAKLLSGHPA